MRFSGLPLSMHPKHNQVDLTVLATLFTELAQRLHLRPVFVDELASQ
ncbi:hypothetical protein ADA01nite_26860 [Aneurinibacillus danicus]|uniref:Uncharacterized protein n=1 Tax=Aneurinibacillus danicus TaxID=267746 RepID=A0A511V8F4_9BACL|nr:hypothetical protein [Aneurinibacillus danicus]GEN35226.1 hypothetical protein ADA01nite_26860 [Aneurinibacillus danicus]